MSYFLKYSSLEYGSTNIQVTEFQDYQSALDAAKEKAEQGFATTIETGTTHIHVEKESQNPNPNPPTPPTSECCPENACSLGIVEGENINEGDLEGNTVILEQLASDGKGIYFPAGTYEFSRSVKWNSADNITIKGDGKSSKVVQKHVGTRPGLFRFDSCSNVEISDLQLIGTNALGFVPSSATKNEYAIGCFKSDNVKILNCDIWGFCTDKAILFRDCWCVKVDNCLLYYNISRGEDGCDIYVQESQSPYEANITRYIEITNNKLLSNNLGGILCTSPNSGLIITGNTVVTCDKDLKEIQDRNLINRKEGIEIHYAVSNADGDNRDVNESICANNLVKNCRWSGIYCNNSIYGDGNPGGIKGSITGNTIVNTCVETKKYQVANKRAGICIQQHQQLVIANNVIRDVGPDATNGQEHAGIIVECTTPKTKNINCSAIVNNNIITTVDGHGILVGNSGGKYNITSNIVQNCTKAFLFVNGLAKGGFHIDGNSFLNEIDNYGYHKMVILAGGKDGNLNFTNNLISSEDKVIFANTVIMLHCALTKANIIGNKLIGPTAHTANVRGMYLDVIKKSGRHLEMVLKDNYITNAKYGVYGGGSPAAFCGPTIMEGTTWENVTVKISGDSKPYIFEGEKTFEGRCSIYSDSNPSNGTWLLGDSRTVKIPKLDQPFYFACVKSGNGSSSNWLGGSKIRNR